MSMDSLKDLYVEQLRDLYSAETQILKALPMMAERAHNPELKAAFTEHERVTHDQVQRLEAIFDGLGEKPGGHHCKGMEGLLKEGQEMIKEKGDPDTIDAGLIAAAQRVEHYDGRPRPHPAADARRGGPDRPPPHLARRAHHQPEGPGRRLPLT